MDGFLSRSTRVAVIRPCTNNEEKELPFRGSMMYGHTHKGGFMSVAKIAITLEQDILYKLDQLVQRRVFPSRSRAIQEAVREKVIPFSTNRLAEECAKLDPADEELLAEEGMSGEMVSWPEY